MLFISGACSFVELFCRISSVELQVMDLIFKSLSGVLDPGGIAFGYLFWNHLRLSASALIGEYSDCLGLDKH